MNERRDTAGAMSSVFGMKTFSRATETRRFSLAQAIERANAAHDLVALIGKTVRLVRDGGKWRGACPFHGDQRLSTFTVDSQTNRYACSVCKAEGDALTWIMHEQGLNFHQVVALSLHQPVETNRRPKEAIRNAITCAAPPPSDEASRRHKHELARRIWNEALSPQHTLVERYLFTRGIVFDGALPECLRFHPNLLHEPSCQYFPAMVAMAQKGDGSFSGIHRTYLSPDGYETANVIKGGVRRMLSDCFGAHVHVQDGKRGALLIAEDVETALAIAQACPDHNVWASMALGNMKAPVPSDAPEIVLCADGNNSDPHMAERIMLEASRELSSHDHKVLIARAPRGMSFNDILLA